jgi:hypothetical protein
MGNAMDFRRRRSVLLLFLALTAGLSLGAAMSLAGLAIR